MSEEGSRLAKEQVAAGQKFEGASGGSSCFGWADDGADRQALVKENCRLRHDQVGLKFFAAERRGVQVRENDVAVGEWRSVAGFVAPGLEMHDLGAADAEHDAQNLHTGDALGKLGIEAGAALFDGGEMKAGGVGDGLQVIGVGGVGVGSGDRGMFAGGDGGDRLWKRVAEIGIFVGAAVAGVPSGVDGEFHQVGEAADLLRAGGLAAGQVAEVVEIDGVGAFGGEVGVDELFVGEFVLGVVVNVLGHVLVENGDCRGVGGITAAARDLAVLNAGEFVVLLP